MNAGEQWKHIGEGDADLSALLNKDITKIPSKDPLEQIKRKLLLNGIIGLFIAGGYVLILIFFPDWRVLLRIGIVLLCTVWLSTKTLLLYNKIEKKNTADNLLQKMERHYRTMQTWMRIQWQIGLFMYPPAAAGGFMVGGSLGNGKSIEEVMRNPVMEIAILITVIILVPIGFYTAKWLTKKMFGAYMIQLKQNIDTLKAER